MRRGLCHYHCIWNAPPHLAPAASRHQLIERAGENSDLHKKHRVYLQYVGGVTSLPYDFDERLSEVYAGVYRNLGLFVPDAHDLVFQNLHAITPGIEMTLVISSKRCR